MVKISYSEHKPPPVRPWVDFHRISLSQERVEEIQGDTVMTRGERTSQAPTAAKLGAGTGLVSTDLAGGLLVDPEEGSGTSADLEGSWPTLTFFFFLSKAV